MVDDTSQSDGGVQTSRRKLLQAGGVTTAAILAGCADGPGAAAGERVGPLTLEVGQNTNFPDVAQEVARQWGELGVEFEIETDTWGPYVPRIYSDNEFENVAHSPWGSSPDRIDPDFFLSTYRSDSVQNIPGYENEEYDELFREQRAAYDPEERAEIISEMQEILHEDLPEITYLWVQATLPVNSRLWDITPTEFVGARTTGSMTVLTAEPLEDERQLVVGGEQELDAPNPLAPDSNDVQYLFKLAYDTPMRVGLDGEVTEWAVEDVEEVDEETLDLTLREEMTFHDGEPVTADDLAFTLNFLSEYNFPSFDAYTADIDGAETETDLTVRVELDGPNVAFVNSALTFINLLPEHVWADVPDQADEPVNWNADVDDLVGSGPLEITEWTGTELQYEAFDDHFEPVAYDEFIFVNRASMEAIRSDFEAENIHMTTSSPPISVTEDLAENDYIEMSNAPGVLQQKFSFDLSTPPFDDKAFRQALLLAVDTDRLSDIFWDGYTDIGDGTLLHPRSELTSDHLPDAEQDLEEARTVLEDAGYTFEDGVLYYPE